MIAILMSSFGFASKDWKQTTFSVYSPKYEGRKMANGKPYKKNELTCASNKHKLGTTLQVRVGDRSCYVKVTDRMSTRLGRYRVDLSSKAFKTLYPKYDYSTTSKMLKTQTIAKGSYRKVK